MPQQQQQQVLQQVHQQVPQQPQLNVYGQQMHQQQLFSATHQALPASVAPEPHGALLTVAPFPLGTVAGLSRPCLACRHAAHGADDCWTLKPELRLKARARAAAIAAAGL